MGCAHPFFPSVQGTFAILLITHKPKVLLLNARLVQNKAILIQDLLLGEETGLECIRKSEVDTGGGTAVSQASLFSIYLGLRGE